MTERFIIDKKISLDDDKIETYELSALVDTENKSFYFIVDSLANVESFCNRLNSLNDENKRLKKANDRLQFRTVDMLDYIKAKGTVTHQEIKDWWNNMIMKGDVE